MTFRHSAVESAAISDAGRSRVSDDRGRLRTALVELLRQPRARLITVLGAAAIVAALIIWSQQQEVPEGPRLYRLPQTSADLRFRDAVLERGYPCEIGEAVSSCRIDHSICLVAYGSGKTR